MSVPAGGELAPEEPVFFNPLDPEAHADPYPQYARLREHAPMLRGPLGYWVLSRYADIAAVLRDPRFGVGIDEASLMLAMTQDGPGVATMRELSRWMLFRDPPDHTRLRRLVSKAFTPRALEAVRPRVVEIVDRLLDDFAGRDRVDLIADLALPLPVTVISELLGLPIEDQAQAREWAEAIAQALDPIVTEDQALRADRAVTELAAYIGGVVAERRRNPGTDLRSRLIGAEDEGGHLSEAELISTVSLLFGAGHETTRNLIGNGMLALLRHPGELQRLRDDPSLMRTAVEQLLRYDSPVQIAGRGARADAVIGEFCELTPFPKLLFSTDGHVLPELFLVGAAQFRHSFGRLLGSWVADGALPPEDAARVAALVGSGNARRLYRL